MIRYGIKHISKGYLVRTQDNRVEYRNKDYRHVIWTGTHDEAMIKLQELGHRFHDLVCIINNK